MGVFEADCKLFFHPDEFAIEASIQERCVPGILELSPLTLNQVQCCQFKFTCAQASVPPMNREDEMKITDQVYRILEIKPDGTGLVHLLLEAIR